MFHATALAARYEDVLDPLRTLFGCRVLHDNEAPTPGIERRGGMTWIGDNSIEIGEPLGATSPVWRFLERFGGGMHSVAVQVADVDAALERALALGVRTADRPQPGVAFTRPGDMAGLLFEWFSNHQGDDPRWGHALPPLSVEPVVDVRHFAFVGAVVDDPAAAAEHLGRVLDTGLTTFAGDGPVDTPRAGVDLGDCTLALYPMPSAERERDRVGPRSRSTPLPVDGPRRGRPRRRRDGAGNRGPPHPPPHHRGRPHPRRHAAFVPHRAHRSALAGRPKEDHMKIGIGIPEQIIGFDAGLLRDDVRTAAASCCTTRPVSFPARGRHAPISSSAPRGDQHQPRPHRPVPIWRGSLRMKASTCSNHHGQEVLA